MKKIFDILQNLTNRSYCEVESTVTGTLSPGGRIRLPMLDLVGTNRLGWSNHAIKSDLSHFEFLCAICTECINSLWRFQRNSDISEENSLIFSTPGRGCMA